MSDQNIEALFTHAMHAVGRARNDLGRDGMTDLRAAAALVDQCHIAMREGATEVIEQYQPRLIGLLDEVEQLTADLQRQDSRLRGEMKALNQATAAHRAYKTGA